MIGRRPPTGLLPARHAPRSQPRSPWVVLILGLFVITAVGTVLLALPVATADGQRTTFLDALFTATSAASTTGLVLSDTATHWSPFGQVVILGLMQLGGFAFMTGSTIFLLLLVGRRTSLSDRLRSRPRAASRSLARSRTSSGASRCSRSSARRPGRCCWPRPSSCTARTPPRGLVGHLPLHLGLQQRRLRPLRGVAQPHPPCRCAGDPRADRHADRARRPRLRDRRRRLGEATLGPPGARDLKLVLLGTVILIAVGALGTAWLEWSNPATLGRLEPTDRVVNALFHSVSLRSAGSIRSASARSWTSRCSSPSG